MENASPTPTIVEDRSETGSFNEQFHHRYFPGIEEQKKDPYLVEFDPDDPLDPKVCPKLFHEVTWVLSAS